MARIIAAEAAARGDQVQVRDPGDALVSAAVDADAIVQKLKRVLDAGEGLKADELRALGEWLDRTGRLAKTVLDARVDERRVRITELQHRELFAIVAAIITELGHDPDDPIVVEIVKSCAARVIAGGRPRPAAIRGQVVGDPDLTGQVSRPVSGAASEPSLEPDLCSGQADAAGNRTSPSTPQTGA